MEEIEGVLTEIIYQNEVNSYVIAEFEMEEEKRGKMEGKNNMTKTLDEKQLEIVNSNEPRIIVEAGAGAGATASGGRRRTAF